MQGKRVMPLIFLSLPANAIMAALSVHRAGEGKKTFSPKCVFRTRLNSPLHATPPATPMVEMPVLAAACNRFLANASTIAR